MGSEMEARLRLLLVEDDPGMARSIAPALAVAGFEVSNAKTCAEANGTTVKTGKLLCSISASQMRPGWSLCDTCVAVAIRHGSLSLLPANHLRRLKQRSRRAATGSSPSRSTSAT
jgi:CheY-like chemotaxis protein